MYYTEYKGIVSAESGGKEPAGFALVPEKIQVVRAKFLQELLRAGIAQTGLCLLTNPDFSKTVAKPYSCSGNRLQETHNQRQERDSSGANEEIVYFNPLHVLGNKISVSEIDGLKILKLSQHQQIVLQVEVMNTEVITYQSLADLIKSLVFRIFNSTFFFDAYD
jgi:hypothetical protein